jgi:hypothetical protein
MSDNTEFFLTYSKEKQAICIAYFSNDATGVRAPDFLSLSALDCALLYFFSLLIFFV